MNVAEAQCEVRRIYVGGFFGQLVSGVIWLVSSRADDLGVAARRDSCPGFRWQPVFPYAAPAPGKRSSRLARIEQPPSGTRDGGCLPRSPASAIGGGSDAASNRLVLPAMMIIVGAHYLPFSFLYGMRQFIALSALLVSAGLLIGLYFRHGNMGLLADKFSTLCIRLRWPSRGLTRAPRRTRREGRGRDGASREPGR